MKKAIHFLLVFILSSSLYAQTNLFSGIIEYNINITNTATEELLKNLQGFMGSQSKLYFNDGYMYTISDSKVISKDMFDPILKKSYTIYLNNDTVYFADPNYCPEELISIKEISTDVYILGYKCRCLSVIKRNVTNDVSFKMNYFYNEAAIKIDPDRYKDVIYGNYKDIYTKMKSLPLKVEIIYDFAKIDIVAISLDEEIIDTKQLIYKAINNKPVKPIKL